MQSYNVVGFSFTFCTPCLILQPPRIASNLRLDDQGLLLHVQHNHWLHDWTILHNREKIKPNNMSSFIPTKCVDTICGDEKTLFRVDIYTLQKLLCFFFQIKINQKSWIRNITYNNFLKLSMKMFIPVIWNKNYF